MTRLTGAFRSVVGSWAVALLLLEALTLVVISQAAVQAKADQIDATIVEWRWDNIPM